MRTSIILTLALSACTPAPNVTKYVTNEGDSYEDNDTTTTETNISGGGGEVTDTGDETADCNILIRTYDGRMTDVCDDLVVEAETWTSWPMAGYPMRLPLYAYRLTGEAEVSIVQVDTFLTVLGTEEEMIYIQDNTDVIAFEVDREDENYYWAIAYGPYQGSATPYEMYSAEGTWTVQLYQSYGTAAGSLEEVIVEDDASITVSAYGSQVFPEGSMVAMDVLIGYTIDGVRMEDQHYSRAFVIQ